MHPVLLSSILSIGGAIRFPHCSFPQLIWAKALCQRRHSSSSLDQKLQNETRRMKPLSSDTTDEPPLKKRLVEPVEGSALTIEVFEPDNINRSIDIYTIPEELSTTTSELNRLQAELTAQCKKTPVLHQNFGLTWFDALKEEFSKEYFQRLSEFVTKERAIQAIYPSPRQVFAWTEQFPISQTKVVILGQDPYHGSGQAHGLCFSVPSGIPPPPSLLNIYKEIRTDIPGIRLPSHGNLTGWAGQGVLLLNACLTVQEGLANSHKDRGWEQFTDRVIAWLNENLTGVVFLLWGKYAQVKGSKIDPRRHHVLTAGHPSPLSWRYFEGCRHFSKTNELLRADGNDPIDWGCLCNSPVFV